MARPVIVSHAEPDDDVLLAKHMTDEEGICPLCAHGKRPETIPWISPRAQLATEEWNRESAAKAERRKSWKA